MKRLATTAMILALSMSAKAVYPVYDAPNFGQNVLNYLKAAESYVKDVQIEVNTNMTALHEVTQIENEILELERMGDPSVLINLPGVQQIALLGQIYQQAQIDVAKISSFVTADGLQNNCDSIMSAYGFGRWGGFTSGWGVRYYANSPILRFNTSDYNADSTVQARITTLMNQKASLTQQRDAAINGLQGATDDTTKQSYAAQITALNGAIADLNQTINQTELASQIQIRMNGNAQQIYSGYTNAQMAAAFQQSEENGIMALSGTPTGTAPGFQTNGTVVGNSSEFGYVDNPAIGGTGDPGTSGSWDVGAGGANIGSQNSTGISLPLATEVAMFGSESNALGQNVMVTNNATGVSTVTQVVDVGPGASSVAKGNIVDLTYGTAVNLGTEGKSTNVTVSKVQ